MKKKINELGVRKLSVIFITFVLWNASYFRKLNQDCIQLDYSFSVCLSDLAGIDGKGTVEHFIDN